MCTLFDEFVLAAATACVKRWVSGRSARSLLVWRLPACGKSNIAVRIRASSQAARARSSDSYGTDKGHLVPPPFNGPRRKQAPTISSAENATGRGGALAWTNESRPPRVRHASYDAVACRNTDVAPRER